VDIYLIQLGRQRRCAITAEPFTDGALGRNVWAV